MIIWGIHFACWKTDSTHARTECIILFLLYGNNGYMNAPQCYMYITCLVLISVVRRHMRSPCSFFFSVLPAFERVFMNSLNNATGDQPNM